MRRESSGSGVLTATPAGWALFTGCSRATHPTAPLGRQMGRWAPRWAARGASRRAPGALQTFQRWFRACRADAAHHSARWRALARASSCKNVRVPRLTRPPTSTRKTTMQAVAPSLPQFRVSSVFAVDCLVEGEARLMVSPWAWLAIPSERGVGIAA